MKVIWGRMTALSVTVFAVVASAVLIELVLDHFGIRTHKLLTGIGGTLLVLVSFAYSLRKRKKFLKTGNLKVWLVRHEWLALVGTCIIFIHTGNHLNALVPLITLLLMFVAFVSGLIGKYVYTDVRDSLRSEKELLKQQGLSDEEIENRLAQKISASASLSRWRDYHMPIIELLAGMLAYHVVSVLYYRGV